MKRGKHIDGFIYSTLLPTRAGQRPMVFDEDMRDMGIEPKTGNHSMQARKWSTLLRKVVDSGGWIRREAGETFAHARSGAIVVEVYGYIRLPDEGEQERKED